MPARKTQRLQVRVRRYAAETLEFRGVELGVLRLAEEREVEVTASDPIDALVRVAEEEARGSKSDYVEVIVDDGETRRVWGASPRHTWSRPLSYRLEPLLRVGIVRRGNIRSLVEAPQQAETGEAGGGEGEAGAPGAFVVELDAIEWHKAPGDTYVFEGKAQLLSDDTDVELVAVETTSGIRLLRPAPAALRRARAS